jgi:phenylacetate-coenzyme A ligase PaaK-like adenylate-forming protein
MMMPLIQFPPFGLADLEKRKLLFDELEALTVWHRVHCDLYREILDRNRGSIENMTQIEDIPFLPVRLFKHLDLASVAQEDIVKTVTSSGTTNQSVSRIFLDKETSAIQIRVLVKILQDFIGVHRMPMLIIDHPNVVKNRLSFSARGAGILGLSNFGSDHTYALKDETMDIDFEQIDSFLSKHSGKRILLFGFTFMVWQHFIRKLESTGRKLDISNGVLLHSGGWKKLESEAVSSREFKFRLKESTGIDRVHNFYGMAEQVGTVYVECESGRLHVPVFSEVIIREPMNWGSLGLHEQGLVQVLSILPRSYPGHSLLTEDLGAVTGVDDCPCGRLGKTIRIDGRLAKAEVRGCSDTQAV